MNANLSHAIQQDVGNTVVELVKYTRSGREFKQREYERVGFLDNGWVRCVRPRKRDDGKRSVDYYPPQNVSEITSVEPPADS